MSDRAVRALKDVVAVEEVAPGLTRVVTWSDAYHVDARDGGCLCPDMQYNESATYCKHHYAAILDDLDEYPTPFISVESGGLEERHMDESKHNSDKEYNSDNPWRDESTLRDMYYGDDMSLQEIGDEFGVTHQAVLYWFDKHGIDRRDVSDYWQGELRKKMMRNTPDKVEVVCDNCSISFYLPPFEAANRKYCSQECAKDGYSKSAYKQREIECEGCGGKFSGLAGRSYCSHECYSSDIYEGGNSIAELFRKKEKQAGWVQSVFERDNYTCQRCGGSGGELQAHHLTHISEISDGIDTRSEITDHDLFADVSNGLTLCVDCHDGVHYGDLCADCAALPDGWACSECVIKSDAKVTAEGY